VTEATKIYFWGRGGPPWVLFWSQKFGIEDTHGILLTDGVLNYPARVNIQYASSPCGNRAEIFRVLAGCTCKYHHILIFCTGRNSSVGIATRYGWTVRGSNPGGEARFSSPVQSGSGAHPASHTTYTGSFPGLKAAGACVNHTPQFAPRLKQEHSYTSVPPLGLLGLFYGDLYICHVLRLLYL